MIKSKPTYFVHRFNCVTVSHLMPNLNANFKRQTIILNFCFHAKRLYFQAAAKVFLNFFCLFNNELKQIKLLNKEVIKNTNNFTAK